MMSSGLELEEVGPPTHQHHTLTTTPCSPLIVNSPSHNNNHSRNPKSSSNNSCSSVCGNSKSPKKKGGPSPSGGSSGGGSGSGRTATSSVSPPPQKKKKENAKKSLSLSNSNNSNDGGHLRLTQLNNHHHHHHKTSNKTVSVGVGHNLVRHGQGLLLHNNNFLNPLNGRDDSSKEKELLPFVSKKGKARDNDDKEDKDNSLTSVLFDPPKRKKKRKKEKGQKKGTVSSHTDVIDGFTFVSFKTYKDLETAVKQGEFGGVEGGVGGGGNQGLSDLSSSSSSYATDVPPDAIKKEEDTRKFAKSQNHIDCPAARSDQEQLFRHSVSVSTNTSPVAHKSKAKIKTASKKPKLKVPIPMDQENGGERSSVSSLPLTSSPPPPSSSSSSATGTPSITDTSTHQINGAKITAKDTHSSKSTPKKKKKEKDKPPKDKLANNHHLKNDKGIGPETAPHVSKKKVANAASGGEDRVQSRKPPKKKAIAAGGESPEMVKKKKNKSHSKSGPTSQPQLKTVATNGLHHNSTSTSPPPTTSQQSPLTASLSSNFSNNSTVGVSSCPPSTQKVNSFFAPYATTTVTRMATGTTPGSSNITTNGDNSNTQFSSPSVNTNQKKGMNESSGGRFSSDKLHGVESPSEGHSSSNTIKVPLSNSNTTKSSSGGVFGSIARLLDSPLASSSSSSPSPHQQQLSSAAMMTAHPVHGANLNSPRGHSPSRERDSYSSNVSSMSRTSGTPVSTSQSHSQQPLPSNTLSPQLSFAKAANWLNSVPVPRPTPPPPSIPSIVQPPPLSSPYSSMFVPPIIPPTHPPPPDPVHFGLYTTTHAAAVVSSSSVISMSHSEIVRRDMEARLKDPMSALVSPVHPVGPSLYPPSLPLFKDVSKQDAGLYGRGLGFPHPSAAFNGLLPPSSPFLSHQAGPVIPKKAGKWNTMHVRIAWEIYHHQHKEDSNKKSPLLLLGANSSSINIGKSINPPRSQPSQLSAMTSMSSLPSVPSLGFGSDPFRLASPGASHFPFTSRPQSEFPSIFPTPRPLTAFDPLAFLTASAPPPTTSGAPPPSSLGAMVTSGIPRYPGLYASPPSSTAPMLQSDNWARSSSGSSSGIGGTNSNNIGTRTSWSELNKRSISPFRERSPVRVNGATSISNERAALATPPRPTRPPPPSTSSSDDSHQHQQQKHLNAVNSNNPNPPHLFGTNTIANGVGGDHKSMLPTSMASAVASYGRMYGAASLPLPGSYLPPTSSYLPVPHYAQYTSSAAAESFRLSLMGFGEFPQPSLHHLASVVSHPSFVHPSFIPPSPHLSISSSLAAATSSQQPNSQL